VAEVALAAERTAGTITDLMPLRAREERRRLSEARDAMEPVVHPPTPGQRPASKRSRFLRLLLLGWAAGASCLPAAPKPARLTPLRLYSIGDSITTAFDAWAPADNPALSWVNGFHGAWEEFFDVPDIQSQNQRITAAYGSSGRKNVSAAENGARWDDALDQAQGVITRAPSYVTILLGGNDVCQDSIDDLPSVAELQGHVRATLDFLDLSLPAGATVVVAGIPDLKRLHDVAIVEKGLLGIDCEAIWATTALGFPCGSMLSSDNSESDRLFVQSLNFAYNDTIRTAVNAKNASSRRVYYQFVDLEPVPYTGEHISSIDCFHPSADGQQLLSALIWNAGPFD
jgi:lysophospholipase L1-like esterase